MYHFKISDDEMQLLFYGELDSIGQMNWIIY